MTDSEHGDPFTKPPPGPAYPLVPTRAGLAAIELTPAERSFIGWTARSVLKGGPQDYLDTYAGADPEVQLEFLRGLFAKGTLVWEPGRRPRISYLGQVLVGINEMIVYTYHAEHRARLKIMWERALDAADAAGHPVEWTGDRPGGVDETIPVPEVTRRIEEISERDRAERADEPDGSQ